MPRARSSRRSRRTRRSRRSSRRRSSRRTRGKSVGGTGGAYYDRRKQPWGFHGSRVGQMLGGYASKMLGMPSEIGSELGSTLIGKLAHYVGKATGSGAYRIGTAPQYNSLFGATSGDVGSSSISFGDRSVRVSHREYLGDIITGTAGTFNTQNFSVNPGLLNTFPWLSKIACNFQTYKPHGILIEFKSTSADALNSTNTALGSVVFAPDYNSMTFTEDFVSKAEMLNYEGSIDCKPSDCFMAGLECDPRKIPLSELYIRNGNPLPNQDLRMTDLCSFAVATNGFQASNVTIGELFIIYDIEFFIPQLQNPLSTAGCSLWNLMAEAAVPTANSTTGYFGNTTGSSIATTRVSVYDNLGIKFAQATSVAASYFCVPRASVRAGQRFIVQYGVKGASTASLGVPNVNQTGGTLVSRTGDLPFWDDAGNAANMLGAPQTVATQSTVQLTWMITITSVSAMNSITQLDVYDEQNGKYCILGGVIATGVATATKSLPDTVSAGYFRIFEVNGGYNTLQAIGMTA